MYQLDVYDKDGIALTEVGVCSSVVVVVVVVLSLIHI